MLKLEYQHVDVFTSAPLFGNAAAVVTGADDVSAEVMQAIARHLNLSETVFLVKPTDSSADYRARIFTPRTEIPFAGHPTLAAASCYFATRPDRPKRVVQECGVGMVSVEVQEATPMPRLTISMACAERTGVTIAPNAIAEALECEERDLADSNAEVCSTGLPWLIVEFATLEALQNVEPNLKLAEELARSAGAVGITAYAREASSENADLHVRSFAPGEGIAEDPACGSGNGAAAVHVANNGFREESRIRYVAEQGLEIGFHALVHVEIDRSESGELAVRVGGQVASLARGQFELDISKFTVRS